MTSKNTSEDILSELRRSIDTLDNALISILIERFRVTEKVGKLKAEHGLKAEDAQREKEIFTRYKKLTETTNKQREILYIMSTIIASVKSNHDRIRESL